MKRKDKLDRLILACLAYHAESGGRPHLSEADIISKVFPEELLGDDSALWTRITQRFRCRMQGLAQEGTLDDYCIANDDETLPQTRLYALAESSKPRAEECLRNLKLKEAKG